jgi:deoxycytidine triphosphate deaminase
MILADADILHFRNLGHLGIHPWDPESVQPASYDLHLAPYVKKKAYDTWAEKLIWQQEKFEELRDGEFWYFLEPGEFGLFNTVETVELSASVAGQVMGKSTLAREALAVETAGWVDPGFSGELTLELKNHGEFPIMLTAGMRIAQIVFMQTRSAALRPYGSEGLGSKYQHQTGPTEPR